MKTLVIGVCVMAVSCAGLALAVGPEKADKRLLCRTEVPASVIAVAFVARDQDCVCGTKTKCGQMESCAEARCFLEKCGVTRLDGDGDGVPCESLCR